MYPSTARLLLRRFTWADLAALHGDPEVMRYIDNGAPVPRTVTVEEFLPAVLRGYTALPAGLGHLAATGPDGVFLGWFALTPASSVGLDGGIELGYRLRTAVWGRGYATEGARAMVDAAFGARGVERIVATTMTVNTASRRVLEKVGLVHVRTFLADWPDPIPGAEHGDVVYAIEAPQWRNMLR